MRKHELNQVNFNLSVSIFKQGDSFVAYTPALDLSTYGRSKVEAQKNFEELVDTFFSEFKDARALAEVLESLGWEKQKASWQPPKIVETSERSFSVPAALMAA